ncbi:MAG: endonuclease III [Prevotella sp.]|nr:endonuclease III [Prevotella sp.]
MRKKDRYDYLLAYFQKEMPSVTTELEFGSVFQLLVAVVLSAQCTDKRINAITPDLFKAYPDAKSMAAAEPDEIFHFVSSVSYPNSKARHLVEMSRMIVSEFNGEVPATMEELVRLPGVGRKTANVIQAVAYGRSAIAVDTHVFRVSHRLGLVSRKADTPLKVEMQLKANIPPDLAADAHHWLLLHGRYICTSRSPHCGKCPFDSFCPKILEDSKLGK